MKAIESPSIVNAISSKVFILVTFSVVVVGGLGYYHLYWKHRFKAISFDKKAPKSNISPSIASIKAHTIYKAMYGIGSGFDKVKQTLQGVNRNGFIAIYNAFGKRRPADTLSFGNASDMDMIAWFHNQFSEDELQELRFLVSGNGFF